MRLAPRIIRRWLLAAVAALAAASAAQAQQNAPHIGYVYPAGGKQGSTFEVTLGGQFLDGVSAVHFSGSGVHATIVEYIKPLTPQQNNDLREKLKELQDRKVLAVRDGRDQGFTRPGGRTNASTSASSTSRPSSRPASSPSTAPAWTSEDEKLLVDIRKKLATFVRRPSSPAIVEIVRIQVTIDALTPSGEHEIRLFTPGGQTAGGLTNPMVFVVGQLPEFSLPPAKGGAEPANEQQQNRFARFAPGKPVPAEITITLPVVLNGQIGPGGVERAYFSAKAGQKLVIVASARALIPYIADAVPGWFQPSLTLYDADGKELASADHYLFHSDPVLYCPIERDGEYTLEIRDMLYRGREDFVYRVTIGQVPFLASVFPLGGQAGLSVVASAQGYNLPADHLTVDAKGRTSGVYMVSLGQGEQASNRLPFDVDTLPDVNEQEPNDNPPHAQPVTLPVVVNGRIDRPGDVDVFRFEGHGGGEVVAEVYARRLDSPLDSMLVLTDADGKQLAANDDCEDKGSGLNTHHADSYICATMPADGAYYVHLRDTQGKGGGDYAYRLRISQPRPDFELRVAPSAINVRAGGSSPITVYALRRDGFAGEITLSLKGAPPGFALSGGRIPAKQDQVRMTLTAPPTPTKEPITLALEGKATIQGQGVTRPAVPCEDMMQAFAYRHLVPAKELLVAVVGRQGQRRPGGADTPNRPTVRIPVGGTVSVPVNVPMNTLLGKVVLELSQPPEGIDIQNVTATPGGSQITLTCDAAKAKAGLKGNLIVNILVERTPAFGNEKAKGQLRRFPAGSLAAIPFEIVAK